MKKVIIFIAIIVCLAGVILGIKAFSGNQTTDSSKWRIVTHSEFTVTLPKNMKSSSKLYDTSFGEEQIAMYSNSDVALSVAKISYSYNSKMKDIDLKKYINSISIDGEKMSAKSIGNGYYYSTYRNASPAPEDEDKLFVIEALFKGSDAMYSVSTYCDRADRSKYEASMLKWVESFNAK